MVWGARKGCTRQLLQVGAFQSLSGLEPVARLNHNEDVPLGRNSIVVVYMDPLGCVMGYQPL